MDDIAKEVGLQYANLLPVALASWGAVLVWLIWAFAKSGEWFGESSGAARITLAVIGAFVVVQFLSAYGAAEDYCREEWTKSGGTPTSLEANYPYTSTKCMSIWPNGPYRG